MKNINVSYLKVDLDYKIIEYNQNFVNFFGLDNEQNFLGCNILRVIKGINQRTYLKLYNLCQSDQESLLIFRNHTLQGVSEPLVSINYVTVTKENDAIVIRVVNWLNWIWLLNSSLNNGYNLITSMDESKYRQKIRQLFEMYWFKALSPLLMHIPNGFIGMINSWAFFDILKIFNNKRGKNVFSKDYNRDMISRIRHSIRRNKGLEMHIDVCDILKDNMLINLKYDNELFIPHSVLEEDIVLVANKDMLLEDILDISVHRDNTFKLENVA
jgi:hypothetical protein